MIEIDEQFYVKLVTALEQATKSVHSEFCWPGHCSCKWELIEDAKTKLPKHTWGETDG